MNFIDRVKSLRPMLREKFIFSVIAFAGLLTHAFIPHDVAVQCCGDKPQLQFKTTFFALLAVVFFAFPWLREFYLRWTGRGRAPASDYYNKNDSGGDPPAGGK